MNHSIETARFQWFWTQSGNGPDILLAFHGFNRTSDDYFPFAKVLGSKYTIIAPDLFFHGKSVVKNENFLPFKREDLKEAIELILNYYQAKNFEVLAHSFGARLALNCVELFGERLKGVYLMAPDAIRFNPGFWFSTQTVIGRKIMQGSRNNPEPVINFMRMLSKIGLYSEKSIEFYVSHLSYEPVRERVYKVWMAHSHTVADRKKVAGVIRNYKIRMLLFFGKTDSIIPRSAGKKFIEDCGDTAEIYLLDIGHRVHEKHHEVCEIILGK